MDAFYGQFSDFLGELSKVFPEDTDFPTYRTNLYMVKKMNPGLLIKEVMAHIIPGEEIIQARNADYFFKGDPSSKLVELVSSESIEPVIRKLRGYWKSMSKDNQSVVWSYLILLIELAKRYSA